MQAYHELYLKKIQVYIEMQNICNILMYMLKINLYVCIIFITDTCVADVRAYLFCLIEILCLLIIDFTFPSHTSHWQLPFPLWYYELDYFRYFTVSRIMQYVSFCDWPILLCIMSKNSIHAIAYCRIIFFYKVYTKFVFIRYWYIPVFPPSWQM